MKYFMAGIKGVGMSALACILNDLGNTVIGYDDYKGETDTTKDLVKRKINIYEDISLLNKSSTLIYTGAINKEHKVIKKAKKLGIKMYEYYEFIKEFSKNYETISIAGTHGKTTTTAMLSKVLDNIIGCNYIIGDGSGKINKNSKYLVLESCEYKRHFLNYNPTYAVITNIDLDHVDCYNDIDDIISAFQTFTEQTKTQVIACGDDLNTRKLVSDKILYYGLEDSNQIKATNIKYTKEGSSFDCVINNELFGRFNIHVFGSHMIQNALAVIYIAKTLGLTKEEIEQNINTFKGARRRFSEIKVKDVVLVDDYAHHPREIKTVIEHARQKYKDKQVIAVLIPYTYSRVKAFYKDFAKELERCDYSYVTNIVPARESKKDFKGINEHMIIDITKNCEFIDEQSIDKLYKHKNAVILFMGCKDPKWLIDIYLKGK